MPDAPKRSEPLGPIAQRVAAAKRAPQRLTITVSQSVHDRLFDRASCEGRSASNLAATLIESALFHGG